jgi:DNA topoisomerase-1
MKLVVVESPAKAKTIEKYLGPGYRVLASTAMSAICRPRTGRSIPTRLRDAVGDLRRQAEAAARDHDEAKGADT